MTQRMRLANRRRSMTFSFECAALRYTATVSFYDDGQLGEIFLGMIEQIATQMLAPKIRQSSPAWHFNTGVPLNVLRKALLRDSQGRASTPIGVALDIIAAGK